jgi:hypothetical protein
MGVHQLSFEYKQVSFTERPAENTGDVKLFIDGKQVGELNGIKTASQYSSMTGYGIQVGRNMGSPVVHDYKAPFGFNNKLSKVEVITGK